MDRDSCLVFFFGLETQSLLDLIISHMRAGDEGMERLKREVDGRWMERIEWIDDGEWSGMKDRQGVK